MLRHEATGLGFSQVMVAAPVVPHGFSSLVQWIEAGFAGHMDYFANRLEAYRHPDAVLEGVRSLVMLTLPYPADSVETLPSNHGRIARYVWEGEDYHDRIHVKLKQLARFLKGKVPAARVRGVVDTAPLLEREFAQLAGIGWQGKNTLILNRWTGSYFFLACLLTDLELPVDLPHETSHCGTCRRCLDACPTDAFPQPGVLDARKCISYLTIEHRGMIPLELRPLMGDWLFGCDVCQEVCPWNGHERLERLRRRRSDNDGTMVQEVGSQSQAMKLQCLKSLDLVELLTISEEEFRQRFRRTPLWRAKRRGILRNALIVLGNLRDPDTLSALEAVVSDQEPLVRGAAVWALGQFLHSDLPASDDERIRVRLRLLLDEEADADVRSEIETVLSQ